MLVSYDQVRALPTMYCDKVHINP